MRLLYACTIAVACLSSSVYAQWLKHPTTGVPRLADGRPNLSAPAPTLPDGTPDLSGIWELDAPPCPPEGCSDYRPAPEFFNLGAKLVDGPPYQPWASALVKGRMSELAKDDPIGMCRPIGAVRLLTLPPYRKFVQLPGLFLILSERDVTYRQIFTDGRALPDDPDPTWNGYSVGRWQGDTLVVETLGFRDDTWLDRNGSPMTAGARVTERFRRLDYGRLAIEVRIDDPKAYTQPWSVTLMQRIVLDTELLDYFCMDNEKDAGRLVGK